MSVKRPVLIALRITGVVLLMLGAAFFAARAYYQHETKAAIQLAIQMDGSPVIGDRDRPFPVVEFLDYRCAHCAPMARLIDDAIGHDPDIKILLRPVYIGDEDSLKIASLVLAVDKQKAGATESLHRAIMALPEVPTYDTALQLAAQQGLNIVQAEKDAVDQRAMVAQNTRLLGKIGFSSVPAIIIGDRGYMPFDQIPGINEFLLMVVDAKTRLHVLKSLPSE